MSTKQISSWQHTCDLCGRTIKDDRGGNVPRSWVSYRRIDPWVRVHKPDGETYFEETYLACDLCDGLIVDFMSKISKV